MRLSKRTTVALLLFLLSLNLIIRYPRTPHELGFDGFVYHGMTRTIVESGHARWIIHPLSYLGLYPLSHPSGSLFVVGALSSIASTPIEASILVFDEVLVAVGLLGAFMMAMEIRRDEPLGLLVAAFFSLSPRLVTGLLWELPTRTLFAVLVPLLTWLLLVWNRTRGVQWIGLLVVVLVLMMSAHRLTVLMAAVLVAFIFTAILLVMIRTLRIKYASRVLGRRFRRTANVVVFLLFLSLSVGMVVLAGVLGSYETGRVGQGPAFYTPLVNLAVSLARSVGFLVVLVPLGVLAVYRVRMKGFKEAFLLMVLLVLIPTLTLRQYTGYYIVAFAAIFIGMGVVWAIRYVRRTELKLAIGAGTLAVVLLSSVIVLDFDLSLQPYLHDHTYVHGLYVRHQTDGTVVANDGALGSGLFLVSGHPYLPVGGTTTSFQSPELLIFGFVNRSSLRIVQVPLSDLTVESDSPFYLQGVQAEADWAEILNRHPDSIPDDILRTYRPTYLAENWRMNGGYEAYGRIYASPFILTAHINSWKIFEVKGQTLWYLGGHS